MINEFTLEVNLLLDIQTHPRYNEIDLCGKLSEVVCWTLNTETKV